MKKIKKKNDEYIYIVLVKALTGLGNCVRKISNYEYTHIAICFNENLNDFLTFSRKKHYAPFDSGFMHETIDCYAYGQNKSVKLKIFKVPLSLKNKKKIENYIETIANDKEYIFNFYSMITMPILSGFRIYKTHNCMSFVSKILELTETIHLTKKYYKYNIKELDLLLSAYKYKEEYFYKTKIENKKYMEKVNLISNISMFLNLNKKLLYRMIFKRGLVKNEK